MKTGPGENRGNVEHAQGSTSVHTREEGPSVQVGYPDADEAECDLWEGVPVLEPYQAGAAIPWVDLDVQACWPREGVIHAYMWYATGGTWFPPLYHLGAILPSVGYEAARRGYSYAPGRTGRAPGLWTVLVGGTGSGKSAAVTMARRLTREWQELTRPANFYRDPYQQQEGTVQGLLYELQEEHWIDEYKRTVAILDTDEASRWLEGASPELYCQLWDGQTVTRKLRGQQANPVGKKKFDTVRNPALSAVMATTHASLEPTLKPQHFTGGLFSRLLWIAPPVVRPWFKLPPENGAYTTALDQWTRWSAWLDAIEAGGGQKLLEVGEPVEKFLKQSLYEVYTQTSDELTKAATTRCLTHAYMIAGLYAFSRGDMQIGHGDMAAAVALVEHSMQALMDLRAITGREPLYKVQLRAREVIEAAGQMTKAQLYQALGVSKTTLDQVLAALEEANSIVRCAAHTGRRGRPPVVWRSATKNQALSKATVVPLRND